LFSKQFKAEVVDLVRQPGTPASVARDLDLIRQRLDHGVADHPGPRAEPQELAHRREMALTAAPARSRPPGCGVASTKCLKRARVGTLIEDQSTPWDVHQPKKFATRPA
jgi:transposase-like protein